MELLLHNSRASSLHGRYPASTLLLAPPPPSRRPLTSRCCRLYRFLFRRFLDGTRRASPVAQCILVIVLSRKDRKSTRLNSSHVAISYAVFCLKKKNTQSMNKRAPCDHDTNKKITST